MSEEAPKKRTAAEIEADLNRTREELTRAVDELSARVDPRRQVEEIRNQARAKFEKASTQGKSFAEDVKAGNPKAIAVVGAAVAVVVAVGAAVVSRKKK
ncbi:DUF3618 domain-containing protein [Ruania zhangjianzhongii]|uniref:DUF3618 domain-containing protein n=1 Tax=Ruania zhangjianzhongii TaxID=2603206 RepID=UPI0011C918B8|nr:DUF3618 domain-containing protein [Ruania zhangjianzhongii]